MRTLVTGGAGFIGSNLVERLVGDGEEVIVVDDFSTGKRDNLEPFKDQIEIVTGDVCDGALMRRLCDGIDVVFHEAAIPSVPFSIEHPCECNRTCVNGTLQVLLAARDCGVGRVVYASSCAIYGDARDLPIAETQATAPLSPYAVGKLTGERYALVFGEVYGLEAAALRYFNVYGPRQDPTGDYAGVIAKFIELGLAGETLTIYGDGTQTRDFVFVTDVVEANVLAARSADAAGKVFNIARGRSVSVLDITRALQGTLGRTIVVEHAPARAGEVRHSRADVTLAERELGFTAKIDVEEGLRRLVDEARSQGS